MDSLFCCSSIEPFKPIIIDNEGKFKNFMNWARACGMQSRATLENGSEYLSSNSSSSFVVQLVRQVNYGPLESKRFFVKTSGAAVDFSEVTEQDLITANYQKVNSFKNFKCVAHNKFFELNLYEKDPVNRHHWRANIARPATDIDLPSQTSRAAEHPQASEGGTTLAHGTSDSELAREDGVGNLPTKTPVESYLAGIKRMSFSDRFGGGVSDDDDHFGAEDWSGSRGSQSPQDFTACSADDCGYCGHCSY